MPKPEPKLPVTKQARPNVAESRQAVYFELYYALGADRSLAKLRVRCSEIGVAVPAESTLAKWSGDFQWQQRLADRNERERQIADERAAQDVVRMNERQAYVGVAMQNIAAEALSALRGQDGRLVHPLEVSEMVALVREGSKVERLARGLATEREEIVVRVWTTVINDIGGLFMRINDIDDRMMRAEEFADGVDEIVGRNASMLASGK